MIFKKILNIQCLKIKDFIPVVENKQKSELRKLRLNNQSERLSKESKSKGTRERR